MVVRYSAAFPLKMLRFVNSANKCINSANVGDVGDFSQGDMRSFEPFICIDSHAPPGFAPFCKTDDIAWCFALTFIESIADVQNL